MVSLHIGTSPQFSTSASFNAEGTLTVIPTLKAHFDRILTYSLTATPQLDITISGSEASKQVCRLRTTLCHHALLAAVQEWSDQCTTVRPLPFSDATSPTPTHLHSRTLHRQVCLDSTYDIAVTGLCELDINIPWANIAKDWQWTQNVYNSGVQTIEKKCLAL